MRKNFVLFVLMIMFLVTPVVTADIEHSINENILPHESVVLEIPTSQEGDELYINLTIADDIQLTVSIFSGISQTPQNEVYVTGGAGHVEVNITLAGGYHIIVLYNENIASIAIVHGFWVLNYEPEITTTETTTTTTTTTSPVLRPIDYIGIFFTVMFTFVLPALAALLILFFIWRHCRAENYDYLTIFKEDELLGGKEQPKE